ncbi:ABC transporter substrate-binding protein [Clostridium muellerianum]|uniref:ABC transporter substrate-binding protein n=1 Tax=Clostridium muellerianum TaxID=2716538 RepID=UPI00315AB710
MLILNFLKGCVKLIGDILGEDSKKRAANYISYLDAKLNTITNIISKIPKEQIPKVLHVTSLSPLTVDGSNTIINALIDTAGGINAAAEEALQIQWAAKIINPDKFASIDIIKETRNFYKTFLNYDLSQEEANRIINDDAPISR